MGLKKGLQLIDEQDRTVRRIFTNNRLSPAPDVGLTDLVTIGLRDLKEADLGTFLRAQKRFDGPVTMMESGEKIEHYHLRKSLQELPGYMEATRAAGLTYEQATDLLPHALNSLRGDFEQEYTTIHLLGRACNEAASQRLNLAGDFETFKDMVKLAGDEWLLDPSLYAFSNGARLGLSVEQMYKMIKKLPEIGSPSPGYVIPHFNDALKSMLPAKVNPELVVEVFDMIGDNNGYYSGLYDLFTMVMAFGGPSSGMTPDEVLALFASRLKNGKKGIALLKSGDAQGQMQEVATVPKEKYFVENERTVLEHAVLPYKVSKSFDKGMRDLEKLSVASSRYWEEVGEGMWVFDPASNVWYSLGGKVDVQMDRVRHNFLLYDISQLSEEPVVCHVHPKDLDMTVRPRKENLTIPEYQDKLTAFLTATPSRADYGALAALLKMSSKPVKAQAGLVHSLGTTIIRFPNDIAVLEKMSEKARDLRDQVMLEFDTSRYERNGLVDTESDYNFVQRLMDDFNRKLPKGFSLTIYPTDHGFDS